MRNKLKKSLFISILCVVALFISGNPADAIARVPDDIYLEYLRYLHLVRQNPEDAGAHFNLAVTCTYTGMVEKGYQELQEMEKLDKNYAYKAVDKYSKILEENPGDWRARFRLAFAHYFSNEDSCAAYEQLELISKRKPISAINAWAFGYMALLKGLEEDWEEAIDLCKKGLKIEPEATALNYALGLAYIKSGHFIKGAGRITRALWLRWAEQREYKELTVHCTAPKEF